jgi:hypothetical protein
MDSTVMPSVTGAAPGVVDRGALARAVASAAASTPGVARLVGGPRVEVATHYPGGKVLGIGFTPSTVSVHLVADRMPLPPVTAAVVRAVVGVLCTAGDLRSVEVVVEDVDLPGGG